MLKKFDIIKVKFPITDNEFVERPAMIICDENSDFSFLQCCLITTNFEPKYKLDIILADFYEMGLPTKCNLRIEKILCINKNLVMSKVGELLFDLRGNFDKNLKKFLNL